MPVLYQDSHVVLDDEAITIHMYYFPVGSKRVPYTDIRSVHEQHMGPLSGQLRLWGTGGLTHWFHLDINRPWKDRCIVLDTGHLIKPTITPDDHAKAMEILVRKTGQATKPGT